MMSPCKENPEKQTLLTETEKEVTPQKKHEEKELRSLRPGESRIIDKAETTVGKI